MPNSTFESAAEAYELRQSHNFITLQDQEEFRSRNAKVTQSMATIDARRRTVDSSWQRATTASHTVLPARKLSESALSNHQMDATRSSTYFRSGEVGDNVWQHIRQATEGVAHGHLEHIGYAKAHSGERLQPETSMKWSPNNITFPGLMSAIRFFGENQLHLTNIVAARIGKCLKTLSSIQGYSEAVTVV